MTVREKHDGGGGFMGTLLGLALGFYLGARVGPNGVDELLKAWTTITESEDFKSLSATAMATLENLTQQGGEVAAKILAGLIGDMTTRRDKTQAAAHDNIADGLWTAISHLPEVQGLVSSGAALVIQLLQQGLAEGGTRRQ
jgi:hypothetical protein